MSPVNIGQHRNYYCCGDLIIFLHDRPCISPRMKSISYELDNMSEWDTGTMCVDRRFYHRLCICYVAQEIKQCMYSRDNLAMWSIQVILALRRETKFSMH